MRMTTVAKAPDASVSPDGYAAALDRMVRDDPRLAPYRGYRPVSLEAGFEHLKGLQRILSHDGWSRLGWPEPVGGLGGDPVLRAVLFETLTAHDIPLPESYLTLEILVPVLLVHAPHLAREFFPRLLAGDELWCQAFSE